MSETRRVSAILHERGSETWARATGHPMVQQIGEGTLPHDTFRYYFSQNILYLEDYCRALALTAAKAPDAEAIQVISTFLERVASEEIAANLDFYERLGGNPSSIDHMWTMAPTTYGYTRHLLSVTSLGDCAAGLTAVLPCQWSYGELAKPLVKQLPGDPIYSDWINVFGNDDYDALVDATTGLLDRLVEPDDKGRLEELFWIFEASTRYEVMFWDMALAGG